MIYTTESLVHRGNRTTLNSLSNDYDGSEFLYALEQMDQINIEIVSIMQEAYMKKDIPLHESLDIKSLLTKMINKFIDIIKNVFAHFNAFLMKAANSSSFIYRYKDKILRFDDVIEVDFDRYLYTCIDKNIPKTDIVLNFERELEIFESQLGKFKNFKNKPERLDAMNQIYKDIKEIIVDNFYDRMRASSIAKTISIPEDQFANELFKVYRNGGDFYTCKINRNEVHDTFNRFTNAKSLIKDVEKQKGEIVSAAKKVEKKLNSISLDSIATNYIPYDLAEEEAFDRICKLKVDQINNCCKIYTLAFSAKIDALKESISQDRKVLNEVLYYMEANRL